MNIGTVYLIGAGPGDPGLITVRGQEILAEADVIVYDRLVHPAALNATRPDAERIYVGKASAHHSMKQPDINAVLVDRALQGKKVARLKGGDPFVFGRGGEEAEACLTAGIRFEIVPGVTSAIAAPAYAGIPVTHRDAASSFAIITGHERDDARESGERAPGAAEGRRNWARIAYAADTLIFLMGVEALPDITTKLQEQGRTGDTPVALVEWGTWSRQRVVTGTLQTILDEVRAAGIRPPAVCVVGDVVRLREKLRWFDDPVARPLVGKRVLVTRAREQASTLSELLRSRGAEPIEFPTIRIQRIADTEAIDSAIQRLNDYAWTVFTSANAVAIFAERLAQVGLDGRAFGSCRIAAIGPATAEALKKEMSLRADFVPTEAVAEAVLAQWPDADVQGRWILLPRAQEAREILPEQLRIHGAVVDVVPLYETVLDGDNAQAVRAQLEAGEVDILTFASSSTVRNFAEALVSGDKERLQALLGNVTIAAIGPVTADTVREHGLTPHIVAEEHTIPGLVQALENALCEN